MRISEIFRLVWLNLSQNKFKVVLTSIGIVVGSATIMMVLAIGTGGKEEIAEQFKNLNAGAIDISYSGAGSSAGFSMVQGMQSATTGGRGQNNSDSGGRKQGGMEIPSRDGGASFSMEMMPSGQGMPFVEEMPDGMEDFAAIFGIGGDSQVNEKVILTQEDCQDLELMVPGLSATTISYSTNAAVEGGELEDASYYTVAGVKDNYVSISNLDMAIGSFLTMENEESKEKVCVLGSTVAKDIFSSAYNAYDGVVYIDDRPYTVAGVLDEMGTVASGINPDTTIFIPYETGIKYLTGSSINPTLTVIAEDVNHVDSVMTDIESVLKESYPNTTFTISDAGSKMDAASASNDTLSLLLVSMAVIVFIVGGIGIMNVLFVSVKERTNEIGILKALGCSRRDILLEFLLEASCISLVGAVIGVLLSLGLTPLIELLNVRVELSIGGAVLSLFFGVLTGSIFGFYPALKASRLVPVVALNQE